MGTIHGTLGAQIEAYWDERSRTYSNGVRGELSDGRRDAWAAVIEREGSRALGAARAAGRVPKVADLGCGPGFFSILLAEMGCRVEGVDGSRAMLERARANARDLGVSWQIGLTLGDVTRLRFADDTFDLIVMRNVTWLLRKPDVAYAEWLRVLRPGGTLLVFDANWYLYLVDPLLDERRVADQAGRVVREWDEDSRATADEEERCERIAERLPLTAVVRPAWDLLTLKRLGATRVMADTGVWRELWTESEQRFYATSPLVLVKAEKAP